MKKNLIKVTIILSMLLLTLIPLSVNAATSGTCGDNLTWKLDANGKLTISGTGEMYSFDDDDPEWYDSKASIKEIVLNKGVTSVGEYAFSNCSNLTKLSMPEGITEIGKAAFMNCNKLENFVMPSTVTEIYSSAFSSCRTITEISLQKVTFIGSDAFKSTSLKEVSIPNGATIGTWAFGYCSSLKEVIVGNDCLIRDYAFYNCYNITELTIKDGVTTIGNYAFNDCDGLTSVVLPDSMKYIYPWAFYSCSNLESITLPTNLYSIGNSAFEYCNKLTNVYYRGTEDEWKKISINSYNTNLINATRHYSYTGLIDYLTYSISNNKVKITDCDTNASGNHTIPSIIEGYPVTTIDYNAFRDCSNLTSIRIPDTVTDINGSAFENCTKLSEITLSKDLKWIGGSTFGNCTNLISITLPENVSDFGDRAFYGCTKLENIYVNENNAKFYSVDGVLFDKEITTLCQYPIGKKTNAYTIPNTVNTIKSYAFEYCATLSEITIPNSVKNIGFSAFRYSSGLKNVYYNGTKAQWDKISIGSSNTPLTNANIIFNVQTINLTYNLNGGKGETETVEIEENCSTTISSLTPTKDGYTFLGWSISSSAKTPEYSTDDIITVGTEDITLYAVWKKIICTQTQSLNGIFLVTPTGAENGNRIIFVCYNGDKMVYVNPYVYAGETTIPFTTTEKYDKVKVMVWENLETCMPLCKAENVPLN